MKIEGGKMSIGAATPEFNLGFGSYQTWIAGNCNRENSVLTVPGTNERVPGITVRDVET